MKQRVAILGSTGSIGVSTLDVISRHSDLFEVFALTASTQVNLMLAQIRQFKPQYVVMASVEHGKELERLVRAHSLSSIVFYGSEAIENIAKHESVDIVMAAIVGAAGLPPCMAAARSGKRLLLANKEALVVGAELFLDAVQSGGATLLPIDSEHSAIFQCLPSQRSMWAESVEKIILTASGGPFRTRDVSTLKLVTPKEACSHPNWVMGRKISVDSATMMNKALEVIEAKYLFNVELTQIEVVIHPQSVIHSMVQFRDASVLAQLGTPDMRGPIAYGLSWPKRVENGSSPIDFKNIAAMTFEAIDSNNHPERFPGLSLAWEVLRAPAGTTAVLNAANEVAVQAFLDERIRFDQIHMINHTTLSEVMPVKPQNLGDLLDIDAQSRQTALAQVRRYEN